MLRRRLLVVAYYFPPMGLSGVQRVAKFVKYLPDFGWDPVVLTVDPGGYFAYDESLAAEIKQMDIPVYRTDSWDPTRLFGRKKTVSMPSKWTRKVFSSLTNFFFVPDNKVGWKRHAVAQGRKLLEEYTFDAIFSSAPPYTAHLIAYELSRQSKLPLVTDFRDDWVGNPYLRIPTPIHRKWHQRLEEKVLRLSDHVTTINRPIKEALIKRNLKRTSYTKCSIVPHGYDPEDFQPNGEAPVARLEDRCRFLYSGVFYDVRTPDYFLRGVHELLKRRPAMREKIELVFVGLVPDSSKELAQELGIDDLMVCQGYLDHGKAVDHLQKADVLWMTIGHQPGEEGISTSKLYEYMGSRKPILGLVPEGAARQTLERYDASLSVLPEDVSAISRAVEQAVNQWQQDRLPQPDASFVEQFDRKTLTGQLAKLLHDVCAVE